MKPDRYTAYAPPGLPPWREVRAVLASTRTTARLWARVSGVGEQTAYRFMAGQRVSEGSQARLRAGLGKLRLLRLLEHQA